MAPQVKRIEYLRYLSDDRRIRVHRTTQGNEVLAFVEQLEVALDGEWLPVVRYDTAHDHAHRDLIVPGKGQQKTPMREGIDYKTAAAEARQDLEANADRYVSDYLEKRR